MNRYTPFERACSASLVGFLLSLVILWFLLAGTGLTLWYFLLPPLVISLVVGSIVWLITSIFELRYQIATLRSEVERLKSEE